MSRFRRSSPAAEDDRPPYETDYAARYEEVWLRGRFGPEARLQAETIAELLRPGSRWLDAGCGTGHYLGLHPGVTRAGIDASDAMLEHARRASPDALFFRRWDLRDDDATWHDQWDLVTSNGQPWSYVSNMEEIERIASNLARWVAPTGQLTMQVSDISDLTGLAELTNYHGRPSAEDAPVITGVFWSVRESGVFHENMLFPSVDHWVRILAQHFRRVEVRRWPHDPGFLFLPRRVLVAGEKRGDADDGAPADILVDPVPSGDALVDQTAAEDAVNPFRRLVGRGRSALRRMS